MNTAFGISHYDGGFLLLLLCHDNNREMDGWILPFKVLRRLIIPGGMD